MKKKLLALILIGMMVVACTGCTKLGKWNIYEVKAGDIVMDEDDISEMGLDAGFIKLNKSGSCVVNLLGEEYEGTWEGEDENMTIKYGDDMAGTASIKGGNMTFVDAQGAEYQLKK